MVKDKRKVDEEKWNLNQLFVYLNEINVVKRRKKKSGFIFRQFCKGYGVLLQKEK